ncbi:MAG: aldehyde dehydrogenase family protein [Actinomycetota bacterium]|nr:aldehyde dehydrogenase family protein [Actinomycetota bacterium]
MGASALVSENPARPDEVVGTFAQTSATEVGEILARAVEAQAHWAALPPGQRATLIGGVAHALARETNELVELVTREEGKTLAESRGEVQKAAEQFHFASQLSFQVEGATFPEEEVDTFTYTLRAPLGVVVAISPWNFPLSLPARKIAPALAAGNAVVLKPSPATPAVGSALVRVFQEAGLPDDLVQLVQGSEDEAMQALVADPRVAALTFTGSDEAGEVIRRRARAGVRVQLELGGHNLVVVCADADVARAASAVVRGGIGLAGQACTATDRALVEASVFEDFKAAVAAELARVRVGDGATPGVSCGPVATRAQFERLGALARAALDAGGEPVGVAAVDLDALEGGGYFVEPRVFAGLADDHPAVTREIFGPMLSIAPIDHLDEGIAAVNADAHGLVTAVHTTNLASATRFAREARCGIVKVNRRTTGNGVAPPFGGWKASSSGAFPEGGRQALDFFTDTKTVYSGF